MMKTTILPINACLVLFSLIRSFPRHPVAEGCYRLFILATLYHNSRMERNGPFHSRRFDKFGRFFYTVPREEDRPMLWKRIGVLLFKGVILAP